MIVECRGDDPAGLYLALLLKEKDPARTVRIIAPAERYTDPSPQLIETPIRPAFALRDAALNDAVRRHTTRFTGVEIVAKGATIRSEQPYAVVQTAALHEILKMRALRAGCEWVDRSTAPASAEADIIIAADGPDSATRNLQQAFGTLSEPSTLYHVVIAVDAAPPILRLMFAETEHGMLHAYHFPGTQGGSTLVVEAPRHVLAGCKTFGANAEAIAEFCKAQFRDQIGGDVWRILSEHWQPFVSMRNKAWCAGNTILIGNAASTAHVSVGLALRDALESAEILADAIAGRSDWHNAFDAAARPRIAKAESLYRASSASVTWFEHVSRYWRMPAAQFAYSCLTRTLRLNHENMKTFAPTLVRDVEGTIAGSDRTREAGNAATPPMFLPYTLRGLTLPNRIAVSPMCMYAANDGIVNDFHLVHLGSRAMGGAGLVITEMTDVSPEGRISLHCAGMYAPEHVPAWKRIVDFVHERSDARIAIQLGHAGRKAALTRSWEGHHPLDNAWEMLAPSAIPFGPDRATPKEMSRADMDRVRDAYAAATRMADAAGFDMIELHYAHGYLLSSFISPLANHRTDDYGGSLENRMRFPLEIFRAVRAAWPQEKPICVRISAIDWTHGGTTIDDAMIIAKMLHDAGNDILSVSTGGITHERTRLLGRLYQATFSDQIRNALGIPTMAVGGIGGHADANTLIAAGRADICALARGYLSEPYFVRRAARLQHYDEMTWPPEYRGAAALPMHDD
ncbi:MAG TPA: bifunctional salicylyl-CoA 5-hydroxylase/oxidoreductase [Xanthobacteraceae bacterium]|nr:bifunctional salicylyl-CoA 5-hydroxylase/oxidoreductase [Xanthobacteraceae bacterium]